MIRLCTGYPLHNNQTSPLRKPFCTTTLEKPNQQVNTNSQSTRIWLNQYQKSSDPVPLTLDYCVHGDPEPQMQNSCFIDRDKVILSLKKKIQKPTFRTVWFLCPCPPLLLCAPNQNRHVTQAIN